MIRAPRRACSAALSPLLFALAFAFAFAFASASASASAFAFAFAFAVAVAVVDVGDVDVGDESASTCARERFTSAKRPTPCHGKVIALTRRS